ncbi:MAG: hypothetical protein AAFV53_20605 [Myxococcota bacterium]
MTWIAVFYLWLSNVFGGPAGPPPPDAGQSQTPATVSFSRAPLDIDNGY